MMTLASTRHHAKYSFEGVRSFSFMLLPAVQASGNWNRSGHVKKKKNKYHLKVSVDPEMRVVVSNPKIHAGLNII